MYNITLLGTMHTESGKCNSDELYKIIEELEPEIIFDELPSNEFDKYYGDSFEINYANFILLNKRPLKVPYEINCIKKYKQYYNVEVCPVDIDVRQRLSKCQEAIYFLFSIFFQNEDYHKLDVEKDALIAKEGFLYLNSDRFLDFLEKKEVMEKHIMRYEINMNELLETYKVFHDEINDKREEAMLDNIYSYSREKQYNKALFIVGAEHRKSLLQKITRREKISDVKLNWTSWSTTGNR